MISFGFFRRNLLRRTLKYSIFSHSFWFPSFSLLVLPFRSPIYRIYAIIPKKFKKWLNCDSQFSIICTVKFRPFLYYSFSPFRSLSLSLVFLCSRTAPNRNYSVCIDCLRCAVFLGLFQSSCFSSVILLPCFPRFGDIVLVLSLLQFQLQYIDQLIFLPLNIHSPAQILFIISHAHNIFSPSCDSICFLICKRGNFMPVAMRRNTQKKKWSQSIRTVQLSWS